MKISEVINQMIEATSFMNDTRVTVRDIHDPVLKAIKPIAEAAGLEVSTWDVRTKDGYGREDAIINYNVNITEDKRYKHDRIGKLHNMMFHPAQPFINMEDTVEEAIDKVKYNNAQKNLVRLNAGLDELLIDVDKYRGWIAETQEEMNQLASKLGYKK